MIVLVTVVNARIVFVRVEVFGGKVVRTGTVETPLYTVAGGGVNVVVMVLSTSNLFVIVVEIVEVRVTKLAGLLSVTVVVA